MINTIPLYLTYDDVLLVPQRSKIRHRAQVDTSTRLTPDIKLKIPLISANMDTVTEAPMAIALARAGGLGVIHRFMSIEDQVKNVDQVTRSGGFIIENPYTLGPDEPVKSILEKIKQQTVSSYLVVDKNHKLLGLVTRRDVIFSGHLDQPVSKVMTPVGKLITVDNGITMIKAKRLFALHKIEKLPVIKDGKVVGLVTAKSIENLENHSLASVDKNGRYICGAAVGVVGDFMDRAAALLSAGVAALVVDVAHGQSQVSLEAIAKLRKKFRDAQIIGGNVATPSGVRDLARAGADCVKVGIGPGGICSTRVVTGVGVPQFSALLACVQVAKKLKVSIIADGGTNYSGDITKALAAGASGVMLAGWFAGTEESPGEVIFRSNRRYKIHRGSASFMSQIDASLRTGQTKSVHSVVAEGVEALIEYKGPVADVIYQLMASLRSGMSYCNAANLRELRSFAKFVRMTPAGFRESQTHNINEVF